jgi:tripartite-type tricarboxylate transporter receptor subunit TctC
VYYVLAAPAAIPEPIAALLEREVRTALRSPNVLERVRTFDMRIVASTGAEAKARIEGDTRKWAKVIEATGMRAD